MDITLAYAPCLVILDIWGRGEVGKSCGGDLKTYGGNARFGRRSMRISPSLGGGIRFSGDHTLVGVFQGTTGFVGSGFEGAVDAWRNVGRRRKHWRFG